MRTLINTHTDNKTEWNVFTMGRIYVTVWFKHKDRKGDFYIKLTKEEYIRDFSSDRYLGTKDITRWEDYAKNLLKQFPDRVVRPVI